MVIRLFPPALTGVLRERAEAHGRSLEAEVRAILVDVLLPSDFVVEWIDGCADLPRGEDLQVPSRGEDWQPGA